VRKEDDETGNGGAGTAARQVAPASILVPRTIPDKGNRPPQPVLLGLEHPVCGSAPAAKGRIGPELGSRCWLGAVRGDPVTKLRFAEISCCRGNRRRWHVARLAGILGDWGSAGG